MNIGWTIGLMIFSGGFIYCLHNKIKTYNKLFKKKLAKKFKLEFKSNLDKMISYTDNTYDETINSKITLAEKIQGCFSVMRRTKQITISFDTYKSFPYTNNQNDEYKKYIQDIENMLKLGSYIDNDNFLSLSTQIEQQKEEPIKNQVYVFVSDISFHLDMIEAIYIAFNNETNKLNEKNNIGIYICKFKTKMLKYPGHGTSMNFID